ncbi:spermatogenesis-associated protein 33 [Macrotis lagotis]|uniref:spermatogenesis-associated protein 33 n=1 Tax=Macrotis lagotis TaxID=92651 RepID=UPI003D68E9AD
MGLNKSKESPTATPSSSFQKAKDKNPNKHMEKQPTSPSSVSTASGSYGPVKTTMKSSQTVHKSELASDSRDRKSETRRFLIPQIVITRASTDTARTPSQEESSQKTIKDKTDYGPYYRHRNPSTVEAYQKTKPDPPKRRAMM